MKKMPAEKVATSSKSETRRSNKPLMEKRRRARINQSLSELKNLILDAVKKDSSRSSKLEKADILEMAVKHMQHLQKQQQQSPLVDVLSTSVESNQRSKYKAGFSECVHEVTRYLDTLDCIDTSIRARLSTHLVNCLNELHCDSTHFDSVPDHVSTTTTSVSSNNHNNVSGHHHHHQPPKLVAGDTRNWTKVVANGCDGAATNLLTSSDCPTRCVTSMTHPSPTTTLQPIQVHIPTTSIPINLISRSGGGGGGGSGGGPVLGYSISSDTSSSDDTTTTSSTTTTTIVHGLHLIPTQLSSGEIAFVLPPQTHQSMDSADHRRVVNRPHQYPLIQQQRLSTSPSFAIVATTTTNSAAVSDDSDVAATSCEPVSKADLLRPVSPGSGRSFEDCVLPTSSTDLMLSNDASTSSSSSDVVGHQFSESDNCKAVVGQAALVTQQPAVGSPSKSIDLNCLMIKEEAVWRPW